MDACFSYSDHGRDNFLIVSREIPHQLLLPGVRDRGEGPQTLRLQVSERTLRNTSAIFGRFFRKHGHGRVVTIVNGLDPLMEIRTSSSEEKRPRVSVLYTGTR